MKYVFTNRVAHCVHCGKASPPHGSGKFCSNACRTVHAKRRLKALGKADENLASWERALQDDDHA